MVSGEGVNSVVVAGEVCGGDRHELPVGGGGGEPHRIGEQVGGGGREQRRGDHDPDLGGHTRFGAGAGAGTGTGTGTGVGGHGFAEQLMDEVSTVSISHGSSVAMNAGASLMRR